MIELALGSTLLTLLLAGSIGYGPMLYTAIEVSEAARAGALYGASSTTNASDITGMQDRAIACARNVPNMTATATQTCQCPGSQGVVSCSSTCSGSVPMMYVTVTAQADNTPVLPYPLSAGTQFPIRRTVTMRAQ